MLGNRIALKDGSDNVLISYPARCPKPGCIHHPNHVVNERERAGCPSRIAVSRCTFFRSTFLGRYRAAGQTHAAYKAYLGVRKTARVAFHGVDEIEDEGQRRMRRSAIEMRRVYTRQLKAREAAASSARHRLRRTHAARHTYASAHGRALPARYMTIHAHRRPSWAGARG